MAHKHTTDCPIPDKICAAYREQQRIIKLLEEYADGDLLFAESLSNPSEEVAYTIFKGDIIALIKGENK